MINLADLFKGSIAYCNIIQSEIVFQIWWSVFKKWTIRMLPGDLIAYVKKVSGEGHLTENLKETRSSWLNCALRGYEAVYQVSVGQYCIYLVVLSQYKAVPVGNWWYWVSISRYFVVLGQCGAVLGGIWWYWQSIGRYWLVLGGTETV